MLSDLPAKIVQEDFSADQMEGLIRMRKLIGTIEFDKGIELPAAKQFVYVSGGIASN